MGHIIVSIAVMIGILLAITIMHEFGHYITLRIFHVPVKEFSIGIGHLLYQRKGATTWSLRAILLMAYVDFDMKDPYTQLALWKKLVILSAGVINNLILALVCIIPVWLNPSALNALFLGFDTHLGIGPITFLLILIIRITHYYSFAAIILFLGFFSLVIGIINILPIPGLDGGWILTTVLRIPEKRCEPVAMASIKIIKLISLISFLLCLIDIILLTL